MASARLSTSFVVPLDYDYSRSTHGNYQATHGKSYGRYADIRERLDKEYHGTYTRERQAMQDELVAQVIEPGKPHQPSPWIVFTAGAMVRRRATPSTFWPTRLSSSRLSTSYPLLDARTMALQRTHVQRTLARHFLSRLRSLNCPPCPLFSRSPRPCAVPRT